MSDCRKGADCDENEGQPTLDPVSGAHASHVNVVSVSVCSARNSLSTMRKSPFDRAGRCDGGGLRRVWVLLSKIAAHNAGYENGAGGCWVRSSSGGAASTPKLGRLSPRQQD